MIVIAPFLVAAHLAVATPLPQLISRMGSPSYASRAEAHAVVVWRLRLDPREAHHLRRGLDSGDREIWRRCSSITFHMFKCSMHNFSDGSGCGNCGGSGLMKAGAPWLDGRP